MNFKTLKLKVFDDGESINLLSNYLILILKQIRMIEKHEYVFVRILILYED